MSWNGKAENDCSQVAAKNERKDLLFTALLNRGAGDNLCYHPTNCQQRVITLLKSAKCQERDDNSKSRICC